MKIVAVFGTRPEAIKMCPLILELRRQKIDYVVCSTGQHREMLESVMETFNIQVDYNLDIMKEDQTLSSITTDILIEFDIVLKKENPNLVLVHGDTTTSFAAAMAAFYNQIPVGHVEAGLRTYNVYSPYPEEFNRQAVDIISKFYFVPTESARRNLLKEGKEDKNIFVTGNTVIDALATTVTGTYNNAYLEWAKDSKIILVTAHRRENLGEPMKNIFRAIRRIVKEFSDVKVVFPIHKNPKVRELANDILQGEERIKMIEPLDMFDFHNFMARSYLIMTDSGGIQEEAPTFGVPVLVMRDTTERPEGIEAGTVKLVGTEENIIFSEVCMLLRNKEMYKRMQNAINPYGDGHASERIVNILKEKFR